MAGLSLVRRAPALLPLLLSAAADGAPVPATSNASGRALLIYPVSITKTADLDFGVLLSPVAAGTAVLDPNANTITTTGGVIRGGGTWRCAEFAGSARSSAVVNIRIPNNPVTMSRVGGGGTMTLSNFVLQGQSKRTLAQMEAFTFRVGATLNVGANQAEGTYVGAFDVSIQYP